MNCPKCESVHTIVWNRDPVNHQLLLKCQSCFVLFTDWQQCEILALKSEVAALKEQVEGLRNGTHTTYEDLSALHEEALREIAALKDELDEDNESNRQIQDGMNKELIAENEELQQENSTLRAERDELRNGLEKAGNLLKLLDPYEMKDKELIDRDEVRKLIEGDK